MDFLFIDTLNALSSQLQSNAMHILTHPKKISQKLQSFTMQLVEFKCGVLSLMESCLRSSIVTPSQKPRSIQRIIGDIQAQLQKNRDRLHRYRLHQILKRKLYRERKQSILASRVIEENQSFLQMEKSIIMIEKDLGIENQTDSITERLGLSTIVSRSLLTEGSPYKLGSSRDQQEHSIVSEVSSLPHDTSFVSNQQVIPVLAVPKENLQMNSKQCWDQQLFKSEKEAKPAKKTIATAKKGKKTVFSKMDSSKQGLLGNLLQQTYNICLDKK